MLFSAARCISIVLSLIVHYLISVATYVYKFKPMENWYYSFSMKSYALTNRVVVCR